MKTIDDGTGLALLVLFIGLLVFLFQGDPDIHDLTKQWIAAHVQELKR